MAVLITGGPKRLDGHTPSTPDSNKQKDREKIRAEGKKQGAAEKRAQRSKPKR